MTWLGQATSIAAGIGAGAYLAEAQRTIRRALGCRLLAHAERTRRRQVTR